MVSYEYTTLHLETNAFLCIGFTMPKVIRDVYLPNSDYGAALFFDNGKPAFYFNYFEQEKDFLPAISYCSENGLDLTELLLKILKLKGFKADTDSRICKTGIAIPLMSNKVLQYRIPLYPIQFFLDVKHLL